MARYSFDSPPDSGLQDMFCNLSDAELLDCWEEHQFDGPAIADFLFEAAGSDSNPFDMPGGPLSALGQFVDPLMEYERSLLAELSRRALTRRLQY